jgi:hypothetical protein
MIFPHILRIEVFEAKAGFDLTNLLDPSMQDVHRNPAADWDSGRSADMQRRGFRQD